jgi:hypothetical protein
VNGDTLDAKLSHVIRALEKRVVIAPLIAASERREPNSTAISTEALRSRRTIKSMITVQRKRYSTVRSSFTEAIKEISFDPNEAD